MSEIAHINVIIATPGHSLTTAYVSSLLETVSVLSKEDISWSFSSHYSSHVANAREITLSGSKHNDINNSRPFNGEITYDKIFWIDSDISWRPEQFLELYHSDQDIIAGAYLFSNGFTSIHKERNLSPLHYSEIIKMESPEQIYATGFGFLAVKSGVFESMERPWFRQEYDKIRFDDKEINFPIVGEDISWCKRANDAGFKIFVNPAIKVTHHKTIPLSWEAING